MYRDYIQGSSNFLSLRRKEVGVGSKIPTVKGKHERFYRKFVLLSSAGIPRRLRGYAVVVRRGSYAVLRLLLRGPYSRFFCCNLYCYVLFVNLLSHA